MSMQESLIIEEFANAGYQVSPDAVALIGSYSAPDTIVSKVLQSLMIRCSWWAGNISTSMA